MRAYLLIMVVAALVTFAATFLTLRLSRKHSIMPEIRERDVHTDPTPRIGGLAMLIGFLVSLAVAASLGWFSSVFEDPIHILAIAAAATGLQGSITTDVRGVICCTSDDKGCCPAVELLEGTDCIIGLNSLITRLLDRRFSRSMTDAHL